MKSPFISFFSLSGLIFLTACSGSSETEAIVVPDAPLEGSWKEVERTFTSEDGQTRDLNWDESMKETWHFTKDSVYVFRYPNYMANGRLFKRDGVTIKGDTLWLEEAGDGGTKTNIKLIKTETDPAVRNQLITNKVDWNNYLNNYVMPSDSWSFDPCPMNIDLRESNSSAYSFSKDTLFYTNNDSLFKLIFIGANHESITLLSQNFGSHSFLEYSLVP